jgi:membrane-bound lytic murein transglycosylase F
VAAIESPSGCYRAAEGIQGFDCDLVKDFARHLSLPVDITLFENAAQVVDAVRTGKADIGTGGIVVTPTLRRWVRFSPALRLSKEELVHNMELPPPVGLGNLQGDLTVSAGSRAATVLRTVRGHYPSLHWNEADEEPYDLLAQVAEGDLDYTIAPSELVAVVTHEQPQVRIAFTVSEPQVLAWALPRNADQLDRAVRTYLDGFGRVEMERLTRHYFGHVSRLDYADIAQFLEDVRARLPRYRASFMEAALENDLDWRMLAAIGYQESRWNAAAESSTGVRGLMMLTVATATEFDIADRGDPEQSIVGAARYFSALKNALPDSIAEPDRSWMALAAYNLGLGHLGDARHIASVRGGDPDLWPDVHDALRLLTRPVWYMKTTHGFARGGEALNFVANVRAYYDLLDEALRTPSTTPVLESAEAD